MKDTSTILAILALITAVIAARDWYASGRIPPWPDYLPKFEPASTAGKVVQQQGQTAGLYLSADRIGRLNRRAAIWTIISAALAAAATIIGNLA